MTIYLYVCIFFTVVSHFQRQMKMNEYRIKLRFFHNDSTENYCLMFSLLSYIAFNIIFYLQWNESHTNFPANVKFTTELIGLLLRKFPSRTTGTKTFSFIFSLCINFLLFIFGNRIFFFFFYYIIILIIFH